MSRIAQLSPRSNALAEAKPPPAVVAALLQATVVAALVALWVKLAFGGFAAGIAALESRFGLHSIGVALMLLAVLTLALKSLRVGLWLFYRPVPLSDGELPTVTAIVPAYNEGAMVRHALLSLTGSNYPRSKLQIVAVDDGSRDDTYAHMEAAARLHPGRILLLRLPHNQGKRAALQAGFKAARSEIVLTIDSDCILAPDGIHHMVAPFADPKVGAVAGRVVIHNRKGSWITRLLSPQFTLTFDFLRASQSVNGTVLCCPGALSAYRLGVVRKVLPSWLDQRFLGTPVGPGEDRFLTTLILREGFLSRYQRTARIHTLVPTDYRRVCKMFLRWDRSDLRESLEALSLLPKRQGWGLLSLIDFLGTAVETIFSVPVIILAIVSVACLLITHPLAALVGFLGFNLSTALSLVLCLSSDFAPETLLLWCYAWFWPAISWVQPYAAFTLNDQAWMSRTLPAAPEPMRAVA